MPGDELYFTDHRYDCGPDELTGGPCIASLVSIAPGGYVDCGQPRAAHAYTEYDRPLEKPGYYQHKRPDNEEDALLFDDDSYAHLHPFTD